HWRQSHNSRRQRGPCSESDATCKVELLVCLNPPPMHSLQRTRVHLEDCGEGPQLLSTESDFIFEDKPPDAFCARRSRQGTHVGPIAAIGWQKAACVHHLGDLRGLSGGSWQVRPQHG